MSYEEYELENVYKTEAVNLNLILLPFWIREEFEKEKFKSIFKFKWKFGVVIFLGRGNRWGR